MIERYALEPMRAIWASEHAPAQWAMVSSQQVRARFGEEPYRRLLQYPAPTWEEVSVRETKTHHDVVAFLDLWREQMPPDLSKLVHLGLTSSDLVDSANALRMVASSDEISTRLERLIRSVARLALAHWNTIRLGRTHGQPAEVTTFGYQLARHVGPLLGSHDRFEKATEDIGIVKMSGAVGGYRWTTIHEEKEFAHNLGEGFSPAEVAGQRLSRDGYARWVSELAIIASNIEDLLLQIRLGQQFGIEEIAEGRPEGSVGSSAMPHKVNPIGSETMTGLARLVRAQIIPVMEGIPTWNERDITHSSVERFALQTAVTLTHHMLVRTTDIIANLRVDVDRMQSNLAATDERVHSSHYLVEILEHTTLRGQEARDAVITAMRMQPEYAFPGFANKVRSQPLMQVAHVHELMEAVIDVEGTT
jgi:adenylosuccinate lyase